MQRRLWDTSSLFLIRDVGLGMEATYDICKVGGKELEE